MIVIGDRNAGVDIDFKAGEDSGPVRQELDTWNAPVRMDVARNIQLSGFIIFVSGHAGHTRDLSPVKPDRALGRADEASSVILVKPASGVSTHVGMSNARPMLSC